MVIGIIITLVLLFFLISYYCYRAVFYYPFKRRSKPEDPILGEQHAVFAEDIHHISAIMESIPFQPVSVKSFDGTVLSGRYYHVRDGAPIQLMFHGYQSCAFRDCSGGHALSRKMGFNSLVVDQRAHGSSEGTTISFGVHERKDCLCWIHFLNDRFGDQVPILLNGLSMGAATVLMAADLPLPENVVCIIADSPYSSPTAIIQKVCKDRGYPVKFIMPFIDAGAFLFGHFLLGSCGAVSAVRHASIPILLIHGEADRFVPCSMSFDIAAACRSKVVLQTFPGAGHGLSYLVDPIRYERTVYSFLSTINRVKDWIDPDFIAGLSQ